MEPQIFDEQDLRLAQRGDSRAFEKLFAPVKPYAMGLARRFFVAGWEKEDLYQEALAGFAGALLGFAPEKGVDFHDFARLSMRNAVVGCVRRATRTKRLANQGTASLDCLAGAPSDEFRPDLLVEQRSECDHLLATLRSVLSTAEWEVLKGVLAGNSLAEVAHQVGANQRAVENALSRARIKARRLLSAA